MTWLDVAFILLILIFIALGARLGSLWTGSCILGGFLGAGLVDTYAIPVSSLLGHFPGNTLVAALLLYVGGVGAMLIPGAVLSQIGSVFFLHLIDGAFGLFTGAFAAIMLTALFLLLSVPLFPSFESSRAFRKSSLVRPYHHILEEIFSHTPLRAVFTRKKIQSEAIQELGPIAKEAGNQIKKLKP